jgi:hypothetical protein
MQRLGLRSLFFFYEGALGATHPWPLERGIFCTPATATIYIKANTQLLMPLILAFPLAAFSAKQRTVTSSDT